MHVAGLARIAKALSIPVIVTAVPGAGPTKIIPEISSILGDPPTFHRLTADSMLNPSIVAAIEATGRRTILISGVCIDL